VVEFIPFQKIPRLSRQCIITEKLDGTNASIYIGEKGEFLVGSRTRWITPESDNYGFARWAYGNQKELSSLGIGHHFGEWWGNGIQRGYNLSKKQFSLFNTSRWNSETIPKCCSVVPVLYSGIFESNIIEKVLNSLILNGSVASEGFMNPEGIIVYHEASRSFFKKTIEKDEAPKGIK